jgi:hypothetical protein
MSDDPLIVDLSDPETGAWCEECKLPSRIAFRSTLMDSSGVSGGLGGFTFCPDCAERNTDV